VPEPRYRLVTRSDFDGLVCAVLLKELDMIDEIKFVHPKDVQDGKVEITGRDVTTNLPYDDRCHLAFDHHASEVVRRGMVEADNHILDPDAPSASRVVYDYYGGRPRFHRISEEMMAAVDKGDSARFSIEEVLDPSGWVLLNFLMDARTGLGRYHTFRISNYQLMMQLIDSCREHTVEEILALPDVAERVDLFRSHRQLAEDQLRRCSRVHGNVVVLDLRDEEQIYVCIRFLIYALYPQCNISIHALWGLKKQNTAFAIGKSIVNRSSTVDIGKVALSYGGGGHSNAGTCQVDNDSADRVLEELIDRIREPILA
jgi:nanoRNase/pAp phosphatase (c-di-AMP/oligoRNAs hydrolase)